MTEAVLVVDDDKEIVRVVRSYLEQAGYKVHVAYDGSTALHILKSERPPMAVLDLMMPGYDGLEVTRIARSDPSTARVYIIMLTARVEDVDRVLGLEMGADDYVTKPFNPREIVARVKSGFRRKQLEGDFQQEGVLNYLDLRVDITKRHVTMGERAIDLTPTEYDLLRTLLERPGVPFSRDDLLRARDGQVYEGLDRTLDSHIRNLRKKIEPDSTQPIYIQTVYGVGYRLGEP